MLKRLAKFEGTFKDLEIFTNILYNFEKNKDNFNIDIFSIQRLSLDSDIYEMFYSVPCDTYYKGFSELEKPNLIFKDNKLKTITHKFKNSCCCIDVNINGCIKLYNKSENGWCNGLSISFNIDWNSNTFDDHKKVELELFNFSGYIFNTMSIESTLCNVSNYVRCNEKSKHKLLKEYWNVEFK